MRRRPRAALRLLLVLAIAPLSGRQTVAQSPPREGAISSAALVADVAVLRRAYGEMHPGLLR